MMDRFINFFSSLKLTMVCLALSLILVFAGTMAQVRLVVSILFVPTLLLSVGSRVSVTWQDYVAILWRPMIAAMVMVAFLYGLNAYLGPYAALRLASDIVVGAAVFGATLIGLWLLTGCPAAPERDIVTVYTGLRARVAVNRGRGSKTVR